MLKFIKTYRMEEDKTEILKIIHTTGNAVSFQSNNQDIKPDYRLYTLLTEKEEEEGGKLFVQIVEDRQRRAALAK